MKHLKLRIPEESDTLRVTRPYKLILAFGNSLLQRYRSMKTSEIPKKWDEKIGMIDNT